MKYHDDMGNDTTEYVSSLEEQVRILEHENLELRERLKNPLQSLFNEDKEVTSQT